MILKDFDGIHLLEPKRSQNIEICLARARLTKSIIKEAIFTVDESVLTTDFVAQLIKIAPTNEEYELIQSFVADGGDPSQLAAAEQFVYVMSTIPRLSQR